MSSRLNNQGLVSFKLSLFWQLHAEVCLNTCDPAKKNKERMRFLDRLLTAELPAPKSCSIALKKNQLPELEHL